MHFRRVIILAGVFMATLMTIDLATGETISPAQGKEKVRAGALLVDVRTPEEFSGGHVEDALNVPHDQIEERIAEFGPDRSRSIVLYCRSGRRSAAAAQDLRRHGFTNVFNAGGYEDWVEGEKG